MLNLSREWGETLKAKFLWLEIKAQWKSLFSGRRLAEDGAVHTSHKLFTGGESQHFTFLHFIHLRNNQLDAFERESDTTTWLKKSSRWTMTGPESHGRNLCRPLRLDHRKRWSSSRSVDPLVSSKKKGKKFSECYFCSYLPSLRQASLILLRQASQKEQTCEWRCWGCVIFGAVGKALQFWKAGAQ